jgi:hypothetical protein
MEVTNEQLTETPRLTVGDLGVAAWACSELFNFMLEGYEEEDYGEMTKEQMEEAMNKLRVTFIKFDSLASALSPEVEETESEQELEEQSSEERDEDEPWSE